MLSGLSLVILYVSSLTPMGRIGVVAIAGLVPAAAVISMNMKSGFFCYVVTSCLAFILVPDKSNVLLFILFFGIYPVVKYLCERVPQLMVGWVLKIAFFCCVLAVFWFGLRSVFLPFLPASLDGWQKVFGVGIVVFVIYDMGFSKLISSYCARVDKYLQK